MRDIVYKLLLVREEGHTYSSETTYWKPQFDIVTVTPAEAESWLRNNATDALVWQGRTFESSLPSVVRSWKSFHPHLQILIVLDHPPDARGIVSLMHSGCHDVIDARSAEQMAATPVSLRERLDFVRSRSMERLQFKRSTACVGLVGESPQMVQVYEKLQRAAALESLVLIDGETGTGKGLVGHAIHAMGPRNGKPFVTVDCGCLAPTLIESELYGVTRGAFTGATSNRLGLVQSARDGTLFLDEIGELPLEMQPKLLRLLEEGEVRQIGSSQAMPINVRVIAATNCDLETLVAEKRFRIDLYYRLNILHVTLPALRERPEDIPLLASHFASRHLFRREPITLTESAKEVLLRYAWPGNVRELKNCVEAAVPTLTVNSIHVHNLPRRITDAVIVPSVSVACESESLNLVVLERRAIRQALELANNEKSKAAKLLGIGKTTLYRKLKELQAAATTVYS
jgi:DNA-binding NtrC family response regulator